MSSPLPSSPRSRRPWRPATCRPRHAEPLEEPGAGVVEPVVALVEPVAAAVEPVATAGDASPASEIAIAASEPASASEIGAADVEAQPEEPRAGTAAPPAETPDRITAARGQTRSLLGRFRPARASGAAAGGLAAAPKPRGGRARLAPEPADVEAAAVLAAIRQPRRRSRGRACSRRRTGARGRRPRRRRRAADLAHRRPRGRADAAARLARGPRLARRRSTGNPGRPGPRIRCRAVGHAPRHRTPRAGERLGGVQPGAPRGAGTGRSRPPRPAARPGLRQLRPLALRQCPVLSSLRQPPGLTSGRPSPPQDAETNPLRPCAPERARLPRSATQAAPRSRTCVTFPSHTSPRKSVPNAP